MTASPLSPPPTGPSRRRATLDDVTVSDEDLVARLARHDEAALGALYDRHASAVYGLSLRTLQDADLAQELVQDVFVALWDHPGRFDPARAGLRAYLLVVTRSRAIDRLRREKPTLRLYDDDGEEFPIEDPAPSVLDHAEGAQRAERIHTAMRALSAAHRETVDRAFLREESREEIARAMRVPVGTVKSRLKYALDKLREALSRSLQDAVGGEE